MQPHNALTHTPPPDWKRITVVDSHTGGEPFRVIVDGLPEISGKTVLERRANATEFHDDLRRLLMWEPRGHADMYGGILGPPERSDSDLSVLFIHNAGFSTMCGHGIIALSKVLIDTGIVESRNGSRVLTIDTPAGQITSTSQVTAGSVASTSFVNVPSFALRLDTQITTASYGEVTCDIGFGGAFYAYVDASSVGLSLDDPAELITAGREIKSAVSANVDIAHPESDDLGFLYGVIFTGPPVDSANHSRNVCIFADGEVDRSPTGTGVSGRLALLAARSEIGLDEDITVESVIGSTFSGRLIGKSSVGGHDAFIPEILGSAHITGRSEFWIDPSDEIGRGFLLR